MHRLIIRRGNVFHKEYLFDEVDCLLVGRSTACDVFLPDDSRMVSRQHAAILRCADRPNSYFVRDLGSLRGTRVNGEPVYGQRLRDGDAIRIAAYELLYNSQAPPAVEMSPLRVVGRKGALDGLNASTAAFERQEAIEEVPLSAEQKEAVESVLQGCLRGSSMRVLLHQLASATVAICRARRAFAALFSTGSAAPFELIERYGMSPGEQIEITEENYLDRLLQGKPVHEGQTLLAPIVDRDATIGFFCLDRAPGEPPFQRSDAAFLLLLGRLVTTRPENEAKRATAGVASSVVPEWPVGMVGRSKPMRELSRQLREAAVEDANVLLLGESGTGKEVAAETIHRMSPSSSGPFIAQNCAAVPETLAEAEMLGYTAHSGIQGAEREGAPGWFDLANNGTLFLDELQGLGLSLQDKLLRVLQDKTIWRIRARRAIPVQLKVIAASDRDLDAAVRSGSFRRNFAQPIDPKVDQ